MQVVKDEVVCVLVSVGKGVETTYSTCNIRLVLARFMISFNGALAKQENAGF